MGGAPGHSKMGGEGGAERRFPGASWASDEDSVAHRTRRGGRDKMYCNSELACAGSAIRTTRRTMSRPPVIPQQSAAGIAVDPRTLERVIPESKRLDGSCVACL